tara:strand:+ start:17 stop:1174 length:1158 start_codon:yes stop_codon:yes gene_type:complete
MGESTMDKRIIDQIAQMVSEELKNENSLTATAKGVLKNIGDFKEPLRYAASETFKNTSAGAVLDAAAGLFLRIAARQIESHLIENADDIASKIVPDIPFDGDVIEGLMQRAFAKIIKDQADEVAALIVDAVREQFLSILSSNTELQEALQEAMGRASKVAKTPPDATKDEKKAANKKARKAAKEDSKKEDLDEAKDPVETAEDAIEAMPEDEQDKVLNVLLDKLGTGDLQEAKGNPVLKALLNLPGGRDLAAMFMASVDRDTPTKLRLLAAFAILNFVSPVDAGTFMGLEFLGPLTALDDLVLLRRMLKKFEKAGLPSEKHHDKLQLAAGEELSADRSAAQELEKTKDLAQGRGRAAVAKDKMRNLEENKLADLKGTFDRFLVKG